LSMLRVCQREKTNNAPTTVDMPGILCGSAFDGDLPGDQNQDDFNVTSSRRNTCGPLDRLGMAEEVLTLKGE